MSATSTPMNSNTVLSAQGLVMKFGGITATNNVTLNLQKGARHALIGPNGAGKTTLINLLTGVLQPTEGRIVLEGEDITHLAPHQRVRRGMVRTFQINQLFDSMSPMQTLAMVVSQHKGLGGKWWQALGADRSVVERCEQLLEQFHLSSVMHQETRVLAYGKRRLLVGGKVNRFIPNPTFEVVAAPGAHMAFFSGDNPEGKTLRELTGKPMSEVQAAHGFREQRFPARFVGVQRERAEHDALIAARVLDLNL